MECSLEHYFRKNFDPGFLEMCRGEYGMTEEDLADETQFWRAYVSNHIPEAYTGIREIMERHKEQGGILCVVSHSFEDNILRDFAYNGLPTPDAVYGWSRPEQERKPHAFPLEDIMRRFSLRPEEILMIDDLKPGFEMAKSCGVDFAAAGWSNRIPEIESFLREGAEQYFTSVEELSAYLG